MHSPETPKTPSGKASKGTVKVIASHDRLQLRFRYSSERHYLSVGLPDTPTGRMVAQQRASQIQLDILSGNFDTTLAKCKTAPVEPVKAKPTAPPIPELWEKFCEVKEPVVAPGTWRNGYCVNTSHLAACRRNPVSRDEPVQSPQVEGKADQRPLPLNVLPAS